MEYIENLRQIDSVWPGEQWFFYWKTSAALWESRILQSNPKHVIFIPLYWGFHAELSGQWDFGKNLPERDLLRLTQLMTQHGRRFCWILPLTPAPYLPNGGVPVMSAQNLAVHANKMYFAVLDRESCLNKMFSFFSPTVFKSFNSFVSSFSKFLNEHKYKSVVWGAKFYYLQDQRKYSFFEDHSQAFEQGFSRFLKQTYPDGVELNVPKNEAEYKKKFTDEVQSLFLTTAESSLANHWGGVQDIVMLGASPKENIIRSVSGGKTQLEYVRDLYGCFINCECISSVLLTQEEKKEVLVSILDEHFGPSAIEMRYHLQTSNNNEHNYHPLMIMDIFCPPNVSEKIDDSGLFEILDNHYKWPYQISKEMSSLSFWNEHDQLKIKFVFGKNLDRPSLGEVLKCFMMGQKVLIDKSGLNEELEKRLHLFLTENDIKVHTVNYQSRTQLCHLGDGLLVIFESSQLLDAVARRKFWTGIINYLKISQPELKMDQDVFSIWRVRQTASHELSFLDIRRLNLYNPTSYKKSVSIKTHKNFALIKMVDPLHAHARSTTEGVEVDLLPNGKIAIDFGHYEET